MASPRLKNFDYRGYYAYSVTICCYTKRDYFTKGEVVDKCIKILREIAQDYKFNVYIYCFMPDHLHLLLVGNDEMASLKEAIRIYKQKTGFYFKQYSGDRLWQSSYYDHVVRKDEGLEKVASYIFNNPVRRGIVKEFKDYPYLGSFVFDIVKM